MPTIFGGRGVLGALFLTMLLVAASLIWGSYDGFRAQERFQRVLADHSAQDAAHGIADYIDGQRESLVLLAEGRGELLSRHAENPADPRIKAVLDGLLKERFSEYHAYSLATPDGELLTDLGEDIGNRCREDLLGFAADNVPYRPYIHPIPDHYHYDIMVRWRDGQANGILFVSFTPKRLGTLLHDNQIPGHRLMLMKADLPRLIEVTAEGGREKLGGRFHLDEADMARAADLGAAAPVRGTAWRVVDIPGAELLDAPRRRMSAQIGGVCAAFLAITGLMAAMVRREHRRQAESDVQRLRYQRELEQQVAERTRALEVSQAELERAQAIAQVGSWRKDIPGNSVTGSAETHRIYGLMPDEPLTARHLLDVIHPDDRDRAGAVYDDDAGDESPIRDLEYRILVDGGEKWVHVRAGFQYDDAGRPVSIAGTVQDITARRRADTALRDSEARASLILDAVPEAMLVADSQGRIVRVNRYATDVFGYSAAELVGQPIEMLMPMRNRDAHPAHRAMFMGQKASRMMGTGSTLYGLRKDGGEFPLQVGLQSLEIDGEPHAIATVIDITLLRRAELELERYAQIVETSGDLLAFVDLERRYTVANPAYAALFGTTPEALKGRSLRDIFGEDMYALVGAYLDRAMAGVDQHFTSDRAYPDGRHHVLDVEYRPFRADGEVVGVVVSIRDISQRVAAERALRASETKMRAMLNTPFLFIGLLDAQGNVLQVNETALKMTDKKEAEVVGLPFWDTPWFSHDEAQGARLREAVERGARGKNSRFELTYRTAQGEIRDADMALQPLRDSEGKVIWLVPQGIDITERKATETQLQRDREQQSALRGLMEIILKGGSREDILDRCLGRLLEVSWLAILPQGGIFLAGEDGATLNLAVSRNLAPQIMERCAQVPMGSCHCGKAASTREPQYASNVDARHEITYPGMSDHGHYSLPLMSDDSLLGVLVLYLPAGFQRDPVKEEFISSVTDILAGFLRRKRDEQALRDSEDLTRAVMDSLNSGIAVLDGRGDIIRVNRNWRDSARENDADELLSAGVGLNYLDVTRRAADSNDADAVRILDGMMGVLAGSREVFSLEYPRHGPDCERWFLAQVTPLGGSIKGLVTSQTDITQRKLAERELERYQQQLEDMVAARTAALRVTEEQVRLILESTADGLYGIDRHGAFTFVNPVACQMLGFRSEDLIGKNAHFTIHHSHLDGSEFPEEACPMLSTLSDGGVVRQASDVFWRADGTPLPVAYATHPMIRAGEIVGSVTSFTDITTLRASELAREKALLEAERLARVRSEFLANMSHEIRTPLNAVLGLAQVGLRESEKRKSLETFAHILDSGQLLLGIVNDILDFSKIEAGRLTLEQRLFPPAEVIDRAVAMVADAAYAKGLDFRLEESDDLPEACSGDALRLSQILMNLLSNAVKFTERGQIVLRAWRDGGHLLFRVEDTGIGLTHEQMSRLFTPFEQADGSTTRRFGGTGLGLAISKRLVSLMGGDLSVASEAGMGAVFTVRIPLVAAASRAPDSRRPVVALIGFAGAERDNLASQLHTWGMSAIVDPGPGFDVDAELIVYNGSAPDAAGGPGAEAAIRRGARVAALVTPGREKERSATGENVAILERPARARHLLSLLRAPDPAAAAPARCGGARRLAGLSVLGAEDNEINRLVLDEMLKSEGASLTCLENGAEALKQLELAGPGVYDIVLTDIQMPVMDGYETARGVHALDPALPVIGITAHAMVEEKARCLAAGMLEHLAKPVELETLVEAILRHVRPRAAMTSLRAAAPTDTPTRTPAPDSPSPAAAAHPAQETDTARDVIDWAKLEARFNGKRDFVDKLVKTAVSSQTDSPAQLRAALANADYKTLAFLSHSLKGMGGNLMAEELHALAARAEAAARGETADALELAERLAQAVERLLAALARRG